MTEFSKILLLPGIYRIDILTVGLAVGYMGYRLFHLGLYGEAGTMAAQWSDNKLIAAPGTFFSLFDAVIVCVGVAKGIGIRSGEATGTQMNLGQQSSTQNVAPAINANDAVEWKTDSALSGLPDRKEGFVDIKSDTDRESVKRIQEALRELVEDGGGSDGDSTPE